MIQHRFAYFFSVVTIVGLALASPALAAPTPPVGWEPTAASWLGDAGDGVVAGAAIQSDGTVVLAANVGTAVPGGADTLVLGGATADSAGAVVRLSPTGDEVLSVSRVGAVVTDLAIGPDDTICVAALGDGLIKLDPGASSVVWAETYGDNVHRVDVGADGKVVALVHDDTDWDTISAPGNGTLYLYDAEGTELGTRGGHHNTLDVAFDAASQTVISGGWRQFNTAGNPVQISHLYGHDTSSGLAEVWRDYDWGDELNDPENNMADTRIYRIAMGADGRLYAAFEAAGGNHLVRYDPHDVMLGVGDLKGSGDEYHNFSNSRSEHKTVIARYDPATGDIERWQEFTGRLDDGSANTVRTEGGAIAADADGNVFLGGASAYGLPLDAENGWLPADTGDYLGGAWILVMNQQMSTPRVFVTRLSGGTTKGIATRVVAGERITSWVGRAPTDTQLWTVAPVQGAPGGGADDGFFAVVGSDQLVPGGGGATATGGAAGNPGVPAGGGTSGAGASAPGSGGASGATGTDGGAGATPAAGGAPVGVAASSSEEEGGCGCRAAPGSRVRHLAVLLAAAVLLAGRRRRRPRSGSSHPPSTA